MRVYQDNRVRRGEGLIGNLLNKAIDFLPVELHIPGYQYCGPGTKLKKRLQRGDPGVNKLDEACKQHDIAYSKFDDTERRAQADRKLADLAWQRVKSGDSSLSEKASAWLVTNIMKAKSKFGAGIKKKRKIKKCLRCNKKKGKGLYLKPYKKTSGGIKKKKVTRKN